MPIMALIGASRILKALVPEVKGVVAVWGKLGEC